jgi:hypothetical protein
MAGNVACMGVIRCEYIILVILDLKGRVSTLGRLGCRWDNIKMLRNRI